MPNKSFLIRLLITIGISLPLCAQDYIWPTDASRLLSSSFAESRGGRFHAGIDIKTQGITGFPIVAIRDGHVSRISISPFGYGRGLYFTLDTGEIVVYGHLDRFNDEIQAWVKSEQKRRGSYDVQLYPSSSRFVYQQGDTLGYTGDSGVGYPHLHFEMRDPNSNPINPLAKGYTVEDNVSPHISKVLLQPMDALSAVNDDFEPQTFWTRSVGLHSYVIDRPIKVFGRIGFGVSAFDQMDGVSNKFGTYRNELYIDDKLVFAAQYDKFSYAVNNHFKLDRNYRQMAWGKGYFYNLFVDFANKLPFYEGRSTFTGVIDFLNSGPVFNPGTPAAPIVEIPQSVQSVNGLSHRFEIVVRDYWGNASRVRGTLVTDGSYLLLREEKDSILDTIYKASTFAGGFELQSDSLEKNFELYSTFFDHYVRLKIVSRHPLRDQPVVSGWLCSGKKYNLPLLRKSSHSFVGAWPLSSCDIGPLPLTIIAVTESGDSLKQNEWLDFTTVQRGRTVEVFSADSLCRLAFGSNSLFKDIFVRIDTLTPPSNGYDVVGKLYRINPADVPLNKGASLSLTFPAGDSLPSRLGIYMKSGKKMRHVGGRISHAERTITAHVSGLGSFALVRDVKPPVIMALSPADQSRTTNRLPRLRAVFKDGLSGIAGEKYRQLLLDGEKVIAEYDPEKLTLIYTPDDSLSRGEHTLELFVGDRAGNTVTRTHTFYID